MATHGHGMILALPDPTKVNFMKKHPIRCTTLAALVTFAPLTTSLGCGGDEAPAPQEIVTAAAAGELAEAISCANITLSLANAADTMAVLVRASIPTDEASLVVGAVTTIDLGDEPTALKFQGGQRLTIDVCDDVIEADNQPVVDTDATATSGTLRIEITEVTDTQNEFSLVYSAHVTVENAVIDGGQPITLDLGTHGFGFLPG